MGLAAVVPGVLVLLGGQGGAGDALEVPAPGGRYVARIAKVAGQEAVPDALARWRLSMHDLQGAANADGEVWSTIYPHASAMARYFTADDGSTFVRVNRAFSDSRQVLRIDRYGELTTELNGRDFGLERRDVVRTNAGATWLDEEGDAVEWGWVETEHGPALMLVLESARGWRREVDVSMGLVLPVLETGPPAVIPGFPAGTAPGEGLQVPYITGFRAPRVALGALPLRIEVNGSHATPNWKFYAFRMSLEDEGRIVLTPFSRPPTGGAQAQVLEGFRVEAIIQGLAPGRYELSVLGAGQPTGIQQVEVLPGRMQVRLETSGGIAGLQNRTEVFKPGVVRVTRSRGPQPDAPRHLTPDELQRLERLVASLPEDPRSARSKIGADFLQYRLGWWAGDRWREVEVDDGTARDVVKQTIEFLARL